jgi:hypothetical protein
VRVKITRERHQKIDQRRLRRARKGGIVVAVLGEVDMPLKIVAELKYTRPPRSSTLLRARALATEIEALLVAFATDEAKGANAHVAYQVRLAKGLTQSLIDQLEELDCAPSSARALEAGLKAD